MSTREQRGADGFRSANSPSGDLHGGDPVFGPVANIDSRPRRKSGPKAKDRGIDPPRLSRPGPES